MKNHETVLIDLITHINIESTILFLGGRSPIEGMEKLFSQRWSCVYTTSRNLELTELFQLNAKRRVADIVSTEDAKFIEYNSRELSIVRISGLEDDSRDELEQEEILQAFLEKLPILLEAYGRIVFDGLDPETDGPVIQQIYRQLAKIKRKNFAFFFGVTDQVENQYLRRLAQNGAAALLAEPIFDLMQRIEDDENYSEILDMDNVGNDFTFFYQRASMSIWTAS